MGYAMRKNAQSRMSNDERRFPPEAYVFMDDVTPEGVDEMRKRASKAVDAEEWEVVDGFGLSSAR